MRPKTDFSFTLSEWRNPDYVYPTGTKHWFRFCAVLHSAYKAGWMGAGASRWSKVFTCPLVKGSADEFSSACRLYYLYLSRLIRSLNGNSPRILYALCAAEDSLSHFPIATKLIEMLAKFKLQIIWLNLDEVSMWRHAAYRIVFTENLLSSPLKFLTCWN